MEALSIQPIWLIDEKAIILRKEVWLKPPTAPTTAESMAVKASIFNGGFRYNNIIKGAIFCHVIKIILQCQSNPSDTTGNHMWKGAAPILINRVIDINVSLKVLVREGLSWKVSVITNISRQDEARA